MKAKLIVKKFGPIAHAEMDLRNVNVFIGPQSSGKSTLAKLYAICKAGLRFFDSHDDTVKHIVSEPKIELESQIQNRFKRKLRNYGIISFLSEDSFIEFENEYVHLKYEDEKFSLKNKEAEFFLLPDLIRDAIEFHDIERANNIIHESVRLNRFNEFLVQFMQSSTYSNKLKFEKDLESLPTELVAIDLNHYFFTKTDVENMLNQLKSYISNSFYQADIYIPAERIIVHILKDAAFALQKSKVNIPDLLLDFAVEYEKTSESFTRLNLDFIEPGMFYTNLDGKEKLINRDHKVFDVEFASTGIQSVLPILRTTQNITNFLNNESYIIEEPELNLYPGTQYKLIHLLEEQSVLSTFSVHTYTTHSPYILSAFNTMLYAHKKSVDLMAKVADLSDLQAIIPKNNWLNPENFNAYSIQDGTAIQILDRESGLIGENIMDEITDEMNDDFDRLLEI